ncbi:MAG: tetratricopeptide repeat protein [Thermoplasmata archaeon]
MGDIEQELNEAHDLIANGDFAGAVKKFNKIIKSNPNSAEAYFGKAEAAIGDPSVTPEEAIECYRKALALDPKNPLYWSSYAVFLIEQSKFDEAEAAYNKAAESDPENAALYYSEFAVEYAMRAPSSMRAFLEGKDVDDKMKEVLQKKEESIKKKALQYLLKSIGLSPEEAKRLL